MRFGSGLSKELREKYKRRSLTPRKGDSVKIVRGEFKNVEGKIVKVVPSEGRLSIEGVTREKQKGGTAMVPVHASDVVITSINMNDKMRRAKLEERS